MGFIQMTEVQAMNLDLFRLVRSDTAAAEKAIKFVNGEQLKYELFKDGYSNAVEEGPGSRVDRAIKTAEEALLVFPPNE
ncbi:DUF2560 family protein [Serratia fonticola]